MDGIPSALNRRMAKGTLDISVISAVEYARDTARYLLLPDLAISCDGPVRSVMLFSRAPASALGGKRVLVTRSSMTSVVLLELLFEHVWGVRPVFVPADAEIADLARIEQPEHDARLVIGDAALLLSSGASDLGARVSARVRPRNRLEGLDRAPVRLRRLGRAAQRSGRGGARAARAADRSRDWGLAHLGELADQASAATGVSRAAALQYLSGLDYGLRYEHLAGLTTFFGKLAASGRVPNGSLVFLPAA